MIHPDKEKLLKILHLYWGRNQPLSYFRYLTVISFLRFNPDWVVKIWTPKVVSTVATWQTGEQSGGYYGYDYLERLRDYVCEIDLPTIGIPDNIPEVHKSDLLRWYLLGIYGGVWSDFDILYIAPLSDEITRGWDGPGLCCYELPLGTVKNHKFQAIGFLASAGEYGKMFYRGMFYRGLYKIPQTEYQAFGATLLEQEQLPGWESVGGKVFYIDKDLVYPYHSHTSVQIYFSPEPLCVENSIGLHWYAGHPVNGKIAATITEDNIKDRINAFSICRAALPVI